MLTLGMIRDYNIFIQHKCDSFDMFLFKGGEYVDFIGLIFFVIISGLRLEISNEFIVNDREIIVKFADGKKARVSLKIKIDSLLKKLELH